MSKLYQTGEVNEILGIDGGEIIEYEYWLIREKLIRTIREIHPPREELGPKLIHDRVFDQMTKFKYIIDLNYDFVLYWILCSTHNSEEHLFDKFYDGFCKYYGSYLAFDYDYVEEQRNSSQTGIFYPHGNLLLVRGIRNGETLKLKSNGDLLDVVDKNWQQGNTPLFISEGTKKQKLQGIRSNPYLNYVYNQVLSKLSNLVVVYGWSMSDNEDHLVERIFSNPAITKVLVSVYKDGKTEDGIMDEKKRIEQKLKQQNRNLEVKFWQC